MDLLLRRRRTGWIQRLFWLLAAAIAGTSLPAQAPGHSSYLEFGTVTALGHRTVEIRTNGDHASAARRRSFLLSRDTRADVVHPGDKVGVLYSPGPNGQWLLERLIELHGEFPKTGPAPDPPPPPAEASRRPEGGGTPVASVPKKTRTPLGRSATGRNSSGAADARNVPAGSATDVVPPRQQVSLGNAALARVPVPSRIPLGGAAATANPAVPRVTALRQQPVGELCGRRADWSPQPISLAVLDFRYPTEREEAHDIAQIGGGAGTALADEVYNRLSSDPHLALSRGDREKLFRMDFAGAARLGRQLGVDTVLLGTFVPVNQPNPDPDLPQPTQAYTLRAGVVETCTGELLYKLESVTCAASSEATPSSSCPGSEVTARQAANPSANLAAFDLPLTNLLAPMLAASAPPGVVDDAGSVTEVRGAEVTLHLAPGASLRVGDQVGVHASRPAKIPSTNTIHVFRNELIGRITISRVTGAYATGSFAGEPAPLPGDLADLLPR